jgi:hypothetical protein
VYEGSGKEGERRLSALCLGSQARSKCMRVQARREKGGSLLCALPGLPDLCSYLRPLAFHPLGLHSGVGRALVEQWPQSTDGGGWSPWG